MGIRFCYFSCEQERITPGLVEDGPLALDFVGGPEPTVTLGQLGEQLTGISFLEVGKAVRSWHREINVPDDPVEKAAFFDEYGLDPQAPPDELELALLDLSWTVSVGQLDDRMRDALAAIPPDGRQAVAERWMTIEELDGLSSEAVQGALEGLCEVARHAVADGHHLYCWTML
ncbi:hypothetical protein ACFY4C_38765 [Actinomadura viridis]|uniref:hypothetical protein n=1 Tax=Actinomadura viridis TaxID=58110 RepID=UPI00367481FD